MVGWKLENLTSKHIDQSYHLQEWLYMRMQHTGILSSLYKCKRQKRLFLLLNGTHYARPKYVGTQYASQNRAVRKGEGVSLSLVFYFILLLDW